MALTWEGCVGPASGEGAAERAHGDSVRFAHLVDGLCGKTIVLVHLIAPEEDGAKFVSILVSRSNLGGNIRR